MNIIMSLYFQLTLFTVEEVCWIMNLYQNGDARIWNVKKQRWGGPRTLGQSVGAKRNSSEMTELGFWGGPPPLTRWFLGNLPTAAADWILNAHYVWDAEYDWIFQVDVTKIESVMHQLKALAPDELVAGVVTRARSNGGGIYV